MQNERMPLKPDKTICLNNDIYIMCGIIGYGGSCIAYSAEREQTEYEKKINMPKVSAVIKEFYPAELTASIMRVSDDLKIFASVQKIFDELKQQFENGVAKQAAFYCEDSNHALPSARICEANNTVYSVVDLTQGVILANARNGLNIGEIFKIMISLCNAVRKLHLNGEIHLDIKPENIFLFAKEYEESRRIALFDFDTVISLNKVCEASVIPFSEDWAPHEQKHQHRNKISFASDIYSIGAVFYWLVTGEKVTEKVLRDIKFGRFDFLNKCDLLKNKKSPRESIMRFLKATLRREPRERIQNVGDL